MSRILTLLPRLGLAGLLAIPLLLALPGAPAAAADGPAWIWPLPGAPQVSRPFGLGPTRYSAGHRGADLVGRPGTAVRAAGAGRVSYAGVLAGRGVVTVTHGELRTTYEPVTATVRVGQVVGAGAPIGTLDAGHPGCPVAACLHWGLRRGADYLDPVRLVVPGPVRLLPRGGVPVAGQARVAGGGVPPPAPPVLPVGATSPGASTGLALGGSGPAEEDGPVDPQRRGPPERAGAAGADQAGTEAPGADQAGTEAPGADRAAADQAVPTQAVPDQAAAPGRRLAVALVLGGGVLVLAQSLRRPSG